MGLPPFDLALFINTIFTAAIGGLFGSIAGVWVAHYFQKKRDDIAWAREKEKLQQQFMHEDETRDLQFRQQTSQQQREDIIRGIDNPTKAIQEIEAITNVQHIIDELKGREHSRVLIKF